MNPEQHDPHDIFTELLNQEAASDNIEKTKQAIFEQIVITDLGLTTVDFERVDEMPQIDVFLEQERQRVVERQKEIYTSAGSDLFADEIESEAVSHYIDKFRSIKLEDPAKASLSDPTNAVFRFSAVKSIYSRAATVRTPIDIDYENSNSAQAELNELPESDFMEDEKLYLQFCLVAMGFNTAWLDLVGKYLPHDSDIRELSEDEFRQRVQDFLKADIDTIIEETHFELINEELDREIKKSVNDILGALGINIDDSYQHLVKDLPEYSDEKFQKQQEFWKWKANYEGLIENIRGGRKLFPVMPEVMKENHIQILSSRVRDVLRPFNIINLKDIDQAVMEFSELFIK